MKKRYIAILLIFFYGFTLFLTLNRHSKAGIQNYHSEIWADKAGYYVYLPATFIYGFDVSQFPDKIDQKTGNGFSLQDGILKTKYTYGVALLQSPFFIVAHSISTFSGNQNDGFSLIYNKIIDIAAVTYSFLALILLYLFMIRYVKRRTAFISILCIYLGTNLFYYSIFETGMSHIYSFFLFTCFLYLSKYIFKPDSTIIAHILFGLTVGLIILVRPINILFLPTIFLFNKIKINELKSTFKPLLIIVITSIIVLIPQLLFWKYSFGEYFTYSYKNEGFINWSSPKILQLWFSPNNGLFIYSPIVLFMLFGIFFIERLHWVQKTIIFGYFLLITFVLASWHDWSYGCSYGCRPYIEYFSILSLPFAFFIERISLHKYSKYILGMVFLLLILYNQKLMFSYDGCWYGETWDWPELWRLVISKTK